MNQEIKVGGISAEEVMKAKRSREVLGQRKVSPVVLNDRVVDVVKQERNRATDLIEDFMISANEVVARMLEANKVSCLRRVVKIP